MTSVVMDALLRILVFCIHSTTTKARPAVAIKRRSVFQTARGDELLRYVLGRIISYDKTARAEGGGGLAFLFFFFRHILNCESSLSLPVSQLCARVV